jgi:hypothetical protein
LFPAKGTNKPHEESDKKIGKSRREDAYEKYIQYQQASFGSELIERNDGQISDAGQHHLSTENIPPPSHMTENNNQDGDGDYINHDVKSDDRDDVQADVNDGNELEMRTHINPLINRYYKKQAGRISNSIIHSSSYREHDFERRQQQQQQQWYEQSGSPHYVNNNNDHHDETSSSASSFLNTEERVVALDPAVQQQIFESLKTLYKRKVAFCPQVVMCFVFVRSFFSSNVSEYFLITSSNTC